MEYKSHAFGCLILLCVLASAAHGQRITTVTQQRTRYVIPDRVEFIRMTDTQLLSLDDLTTSAQRMVVGRLPETERVLRAKYTYDGLSETSATQRVEREAVSIVHEELRAKVVERINQRLAEIKALNEILNQLQPVRRRNRER